jgi:hypothetical protein
MGLTVDSKDYEEEALGLNSIHDTDKMVDEYFAKERRKKTSSMTKNSLVKKATVVDTDKLLKVKTFGFKDGVLQHNMPCPVCLKNPAIYKSDGDRNFFAPCKECEKEGYILENILTKKKGWFS